MEEINHFGTKKVAWHFENEYSKDLCFFLKGQVKKLTNVANTAAVPFSV